LRFPVAISHRQARAKIYGRTQAYPYYRLTYSAEGKRLVRSFKTFGEAKEAAEKAVKSISEGNGAAATMRPKDVRELRFAREKLADLALALNLSKPDPSAPDASFNLLERHT